ncbi:MAG: DUF4384 domain-containing protein [Bacteroidales bacterium]|nr:DUF4384 domain-containing protein [Bacteroidales bacterium]
MRLLFVKTVALLLLMTSGPMMFGQKDVVRNVKAEGSWDVVGDVSPAMAKEKALFEAKKNALRKAGLPTDVRSMSFSSIAKGEQKYDEEDFTQINSVFIGGSVTLKKEPEFKSNYDGNYYTITASIVADVISEKGRDPEFVLDVNGFDFYYKNDDKLTFSVKPYKDCYLRVFWFTNTTTGEGDLLYPIDAFNNDIVLKEKTAYDFPLSSEYEIAKKRISYRLHIEGDRETNFIFIVATKKKIPYIGEVNYQNFFKWYHEIDADEKTEIAGYQIIITK